MTVTLRRLAALALFGVLFCTPSAYEPVAPGFCTPYFGRVERRLWQAWVRSRPASWSAGWRDTLRYTLPAGYAPGALLALPYVHHPFATVREATLVDSSGNVTSCWSPAVALP